MHPIHIPNAVSLNKKVIHSRQIIILIGVMISNITMIKNIMTASIKPIDHANLFCSAPTYYGV